MDHVSRGRIETGLSMIGLAASFHATGCRFVGNAIVMPFKTLFVVGLTGLINAIPFSSVWWFKWVALGMGIATVVALARGARALLLPALVAWVGTKIYRRYGEAARQQFDDWAAKSQAQASQVLNALRAVGPDTAGLNRSNGTTGREGGANKRTAG